jgi:hypothetical protein
MKYKEFGKKFEEIVYKSTGPFLMVAGGVFFVYGLITHNAKHTQEGLATAIAGQIVREGRNYSTRIIETLTKRISELEKKL